MKLNVTFKPYSMFHKVSNEIEGTIPVKPGSKKLWKLYGKWNEGLYALN